MSGFGGFPGGWGLGGFGGFPGGWGLGGFGANPFGFGLGNFGWGPGGLGGGLGWPGPGGLPGFGGFPAPGGFPGLGGLPGWGGLPGVGGWPGLGGPFGPGGLGGPFGPGDLGGFNAQMPGGLLGQFSNQSGQLGMLGGNTSFVLILLIRQVVGRPSDWAPLGGVNLIGQRGPGLPDPDPQGNLEGNDLGYYPPAGALVVKAPSRIHTGVGGLSGPHLPGGVGALERRRGDVIVFVPRNGGNRERQRPEPGGNVGGDAASQPDLDPRRIWQDALARGVDDPGLIIAVAEYLAQHQKWDHVAEFLKANLRQGLVVRPWVYEALALALRESKAAPDEIERAEVSVVDLEPLDTQGLLRAAQAMKELKRYDHALTFCRQAALLEPNLPYVYADTLSCARETRDVGAMEWAAGNLLQRDWPFADQDLHARAQGEADALARILAGTKDGGDAVRLRSVVTAQRERDLVIRLTWQGDADLDLKVQEPCGSVCSTLQRRTVGGGVLLGDTLADPASETYVAAQALAGEYQITVEGIWGQPLGNRARLEVIQHQGTPRQSLKLVNLDLRAKDGNRLTIRLESGRRTDLASVPPLAAVARPPVEEAKAGPDAVFNQLRALAHPSTTGMGLSVRGGVVAAGALAGPRVAVQASERKSGDQVAYQTRVEPLVVNTAPLTAQAILSADRRSVRLSLTPFFDAVTRAQSQPVVPNPLLPGARPGP
jgi:hypothetical protein